MKKVILIIFSIFILIFYNFCAFSLEKTSLEQYKNPYIIFNINKNNIVKGNCIFQKVYPASLTKLLTSLIFVENMDLSNELYKDELYKTLYKSDNDSSDQLAIYTTGDVPSFIKIMNNKCQKYGLKNTNFANTSGLFDENHYTTANDFTIICSNIYQNKEFMNLFTAKKYTNSKNENITYSIGNKMLKHGFKEYDERVFAGKNGYTDTSKHNLATFASINGDDYIILVFKESEENCYKITKELMNFASTQATNVTISDNKQIKQNNIDKIDLEHNYSYSSIEIFLIFLIFMCSFVCLNYYIYYYFMYKKIDNNH